MQNTNAIPSRSHILVNSVSLATLDAYPTREEALIQARFLVTHGADPIIVVSIGTGQIYTVR